MLVALLLAAAPIDTIEVTGSTNAGEGASWFARYDRIGAWVSVSSGSNGAQQVQDTQAGCADLTALFEKVAALKLKPEAPPKVQGQPGRERRVVLIDRAGKRWTTAELPLDDLGLPTWYAEPPDPPRGAGPQLLVFSREEKGVRIEASMTAGGSVWCHRSGPVTLDLATPKLPQCLVPEEAAERLARYLSKLDAKSFEGDDATTVEAALPGIKRSVVRKRAQADAAVKLFTAEMTKRRFPCSP